MTKILSANSHTLEQGADRDEKQVRSFRKEANRISHTGLRRKVDRRLISLVNPVSIEADRYRRLRQAVEERKRVDGGTVIAITSALSGEGKTLTSINLAGTLAQNRRSRVLLIELDLRQTKTNIGKYLSLGDEGRGGVIEPVMGRADLKEASRFLADFNLHVLLAGSNPDSPYEIMSSPGVASLIEAARKEFDYVIIDTPPVVLLPDSQLVAKWVDGYLVIVAAGVTTSNMLEEALSIMDPEKVLGIVFNGCSPLSDHYYHGYY